MEADARNNDGVASGTAMGILGLYWFAAAAMTALTGGIFATAHPVWRRLHRRVAKNGQGDCENGQHNDQDKAA